MSEGEFLSPIFHEIQDASVKQDGREERTNDFFFLRLLLAVESYNNRERERERQDERAHSTRNKEELCGTLE